MPNTLTPEDRFAIKDLLARYGWALDTGDVDGFVGCFAPDGVMIEEVFEDPDVWEGRDGIRRLAEHYRGIANFPGRQHFAANTLVTPTGEDRAHVRSFALVTECQGEPPYKLRFCGYYDDEIVRLDGQWYFAKRVVRLWDGEVLKRFPGRGAFVPRARPPELTRVK
ncbi:MAG TPA: nuclear transport factor 2 family protein [Ramlibacter sp.]|nr:nuclear transport factor 2 family protein [Ramlibacter sp.]